MTGCGRIKAAILTPWLSRNGGGLQVAARRLVQSLSLRQTMEVTVFGLEDPFAERDLSEWLPIKPRRFPAIGPTAFGYAPALSRELLRSDVHIVHTHGLWLYTSVACSRWRVRKGGPHLVSPHGMLDPWAMRRSRWKKKMAWSLFEGVNLKTASCLHALCPAELEAIRCCGLRNPICVVPNGVDLPLRMAPTPAPWGGRTGAGQKVLLYLGRLHPKKNLPHLLRAWSALQREDDASVRDWSLAIAGWAQEEGHGNTLRALAAELGALDVLFLGPLFGEEKHAALMNADAFVLPSVSEGLPMGILEAWAFGLPVAMTAQCNLPEGFQSGAAVEISSEPDEMKEGLRELFSMDREQLGEVGRRGRALVEKCFNWRNVAGAMEEVYSWLIGGGPKPGCVVTD
jgi:glycosyltransferase involved in cell wall biosynthesis